MPSVIFNVNYFATDTFPQDTSGWVHLCLPSSYKVSSTEVFVQGQIPAHLPRHALHQLCQGSSVKQTAFSPLNRQAFHKPNSCLSGHQTGINHTSWQRREKWFRSSVFSLALILQFLFFAPYSTFLYGSSKQEMLTKHSPLLPRYLLVTSLTEATAYPGPASYHPRAVHVQTQRQVPASLSQLSSFVKFKIAVILMGFYQKKTS